MSISTPAKPLVQRPAPSAPDPRAGITGYLAFLRRRPRTTAAWCTRRRLTVVMTVAAVLALAAMLLLDAPAVGWAQRLPEPMTEMFDRITGLGKSVWLLVPIALGLGLLAALPLTRLSQMSRGVLAAIGLRLGFLFAAIALPGLIFTVVKRLIGRARPLVEGGADPFIYRPLRWHVEYASLPSGHATDAFAIAVALGALWPRARPLLWCYAAAIALSRVVLTAHFPSDVVAGAAVGALGALLVRDWFLARGLVFGAGPDGRVRPLPGPSLRRVKRVARQLW
ncbi:MAG: phosphatase PAP2 family protein, partial [Hyphomicrobiales bacterium]|nr:phosphatase PAP2 family protein [Hyphomicrobiales bacterium]